jgi:hypothetical protein
MTCGASRIGFIETWEAVDFFGGQGAAENAQFVNQAVEPRTVASPMAKSWYHNCF